MTIYVAGDSWSARTLNDEENYPQHLALGARLQRLMPAQTVITVAEPGTSTSEQIRAAADRAESGDVVVLGWSDWCREYDIRTGAKGQIIYSSERQAWDDLLAQAQASIQDLWSTIPQWVHVIHWGGQSAVWADVPDDHTIAYDDYARRVYTTPSRHLSVQTLATAQATQRHCRQHLLESFAPGDRLDDAVERAVSINRHCALNPRLFPDGGHLAWNYYDALANRLQQLIQQ